MNKTPNYPDDSNPLKFSPKDIYRFSDFYKYKLESDSNLGEKGLEEQLKYFENDPFKIQRFVHNNEDQKMKMFWSRFIAIYVSAFTISMFITLWFFNLKESTLNCLIIAGFVEVIGVVWLIINHFFSKAD
jgi:hypothetical protein